MTGSQAPGRVLVLRCPDWPDQPDQPEPGPAAKPAGHRGRTPARVPRPASSSRWSPSSRNSARRWKCSVRGPAPSASAGPPGTSAGRPSSPGRSRGRSARPVSTARSGSRTGCSPPNWLPNWPRDWPPNWPRDWPPRRPDGQSAPGIRIVPPGRTLAFLAAQPVSALGSPELGYLLPRLGITTLGEFAALPAAEAANRFGAAGELAHRLARGLDPRPLVPRPPAADVSVQREFDPPAGQSEPVVFAAKSLAEDLHARLAARGLACVRVQVQVHCEDGREISRFWRHDGLLSGLAVAERVRWQLDGWRPPAAPGAAGADEETAGGITLLRLVPDQLVRAAGRQLRLWGDAVISDRVARAAVRVQAMLGHGAVTRPVLAGGRRPADQVLLVPFGDTGVPRRPADRPWPGQIPAPAPATVYPAPHPARVTDSAGTAVSVTARAQLSAAPAWLSAPGQAALAVTSWAGPWPVAESWWDPARARRQARFQLVTEDGSAWLAVLQDGDWLIEASYD